MKKTKRILSLVLALVLVLSCFSGITVSAAGGRKWFVLQGGSSNAGGHNYSSGSGPLFYLDGDKDMVSGGTISLALKPNNNWGVFYSYINDSNWLYVGYDNSSKWYYQYRWNGSESYPQISGLPDPVEGEELNLTISLSNETLAVTVNGTTAYSTNQVLKNMANANTESHGNLGKFGVMAKGAGAHIEFADFTYDGVDCMSDNWRWCCERSGQTVEVVETAMAPVSGTVTNTEGNPVAGATVRVGNYAAETDENGRYAFEGIQIGEYAFSVSKPGYQAYSSTVTVENIDNNVFDAVLEAKAALDLSQYDTIESDTMTVYVGKEFPLVARYVMKSDGDFFRGNETALNEVVINGTAIVPTVLGTNLEGSTKTYDLHVENGSINLDMTVAISVEGNNLTWEVTELQKNEGCARIATIDIPHLNILTVDASEEESVFAGAQMSTTTTAKADTYITFDEGFIPSNEDGYLYAFLTNGSLSAGIDSNSEREGDKRVERINGADTISLTSAVWYYESGDSTGQASAYYYEYQASELPCIKVAIAEDDLNNDGDMDWNDGAIAFREVMHYAQGNESIKDMVNYRIVMNFESAAPNPFLVTADNVKKVYLATDGLPQALLLKGYGNEGHDSANSEYADVAERLGGIEDFQKLLEIAHDYNTEVGIHVNAQEAYPEARSFNETMISGPTGNRNGNGWGWLDQSVVINKLWDLSSDARLKRFVQLYDRINETDFLSLDWDEKEYVKDSQGILTNGDGVTEVTREELLELVRADAATHEDNMDFIYLDVWYQDAWETRRIAEEINSLGWRFSTEFSGEGEYDSTWQHWSTDTTYGGAGAKGLNSDIIRFLRNDQRDSQVLNWPTFGGTADNPLLGGFRLYGFEGWGGQQNFNQYIEGTFNENVPTKFLQHYQVIDWENYAEGESPVGNTEKQITLTNEAGDIVVVTRNEGQRSDIEIERVITLNGKVVLNTDVNESTYLLPWIDNQNGEEKLYHWNLDGGETTWELQDDWAALENVYVYKLTDQGRVDEQIVAVENGSITLTAEASVAYVVVKGEQAKELVADFGEMDYVVDPGFNGYADGAKLDAADWSGDIDAEGVEINVTNLGDQQLYLSNTDKDIAVTTTISGLTAGKDYVAEVYIANESDAKAALTVKAGEKENTSYTYRSIVRNTISSDSEHGTNMQRMLVTFVAEGETAELTISREAGSGYTTIDDIRVVQKTLGNYKADGSFEQGFESVVQGLYPFVLTYNAGGDSRTHLSQDNSPFTDRGWNGKAVDDVIDGEWALKHHTNITGIVYQTIPQNFRFEAGKAYQVEFDYQTVSAGYQMVVGDGKTYTVPSEYLPTASTTAHATMEVVGSGSGQTWIGLYMNGSRCGTNTATGDVDFILDNLKITELEGAEIVTVSATDLLLGETASIYGSSLDQITWTMSVEGVVELDQANNTIKAIGAGTTVLTATFPSGKVEEFTFTVVDTLVNDIDRSEYPDISATANTDAIGSETAPNGDPLAAVDGNSSTFWHSSWAGGVSASNPAVITVDLGTTLAIGGFKFQQRPSANNGIVQVYSYRILDEDGNVIVSGDNVEVPQANRTGAAWTVQTLADNVDARYIEISVMQGQGGFAAIAEIAPISVTKITLDEPVVNPFVDVNEDNFFYDSVMWAVENGVTAGLDATHFGPAAACGRAQVVTFLWRAAGSPEPETSVNPFEDVNEDNYFYKAVLWAMENGITAGVDDTHFGPALPCTRAQVVTFLWRAVGAPEATAESTFTDVTDSGAYYYDAVLWAVENGVTAGMGDGTFGVSAVCNRAQVVTFL
ncbi:MAG: S-layer homology domain-containing protein, partial [Oscillospiraceae bacterium]|nr:S-layer homology domain-containing protein [Oscillospiraceae bacterium]